MNEVGRAELDAEGGDHVCKEDDSLGDIGSDKVQGRGEDDHVEDVVDQACTDSVRVAGRPANRHTDRIFVSIQAKSHLPKSQNATHTRGDAPLKACLRRSPNSAHEDEGDPGSGSAIAARPRTARLAWLSAFEQHRGHQP